MAASQHGGRTSVVLSALLVFAGALAVRLLYLHQIRDNPFAEHLYVDARAYWDWAGRLAGGAWWGDSVFYQAPLYPYVLGVLRALGGGLWAARIFQAVLGAAACAFVFLAARRFFDRRAALIAAAVLALYAPAIFYDGIIQKTTLGLFLTTLWLWLMALQVDAPTRGRWIGAGVVLGLLCLTRENALILAPATLLWVLVHSRQRRWRDRLIAGVLFIGGLAIALLPVGLRNLAVGGEFALTTSQFGPNFFIGNNAQATGSYIALRPGRGSTEFERDDATNIAEQRLGRELSPGEVSAYWTGRATTFIRERPGDWIALLGKKWLLTWNAFEIADADDLYVYASWSSLSGALSRLLHFGVLAPVACAGIVLTWFDRRRLWLLYLVLLAFAAAVTVFFVFGRYRFPLVPVLVMFFGAAIAQCISRWRAGQRATLIPAGVVLVVAAVAANWPIFPANQQRALASYNLGTALADRGDHAAAVEQYEKSIRLDDGQSATHNNLAVSLAALERNNAAEVEFQKAVELQPQNTEAQFDYGQFLLEIGRPADALERFQIVRQQDPKRELAYSLASVVLKDLGRDGEAVEWLRAGMVAAPESVNIGNALALMLSIAPQAELRNGDEAVRIAEPLAEETHRKLPGVLSTLSLAYAEAGRFEDAQRTASEALTLARQRGDEQMARVISQNLALFRERQAYPVAPPQPPAAQTPR